MMLTPSVHEEEDESSSEDAAELKDQIKKLEDQNKKLADEAHVQERRAKESRAKASSAYGRVHERLRDEIEARNNSKHVSLPPIYDPEECRERCGHDMKRFLRHHWLDLLILILLSQEYCC